MASCTDQCLPDLALCGPGGADMYFQNLFLLINEIEHACRS